MAKSKFSTKKVHFNPKKKKPNTNHRQRYWKKENKKIDKSNLIDIKSPRKELKPFEGQTFIVQGFLTNTYGYSKTKRLVHNIVLPIEKDGKKFHITHNWVKASKTQNVPHGYRKFKVRIVQYFDKATNKDKYGLKIIEVL